MPEGRMISKSIATSEQVASVSLLADYLFTRMIPHLDSEGRMAGSPRTVRGIVCPLREDVTAAAVAGALRELAAVGLIHWYVVAGHQYLELPKFRDHQRGARFDREGPSRLPAPSDGVPASGPENSGELPRAAAILPLSEVKGSEVKGSEVKGSEVKPSQKAASGKGDRPPGPAFDLAPYLSAHADRFPGSSVAGGRFGKVLKPLDTAHGPAETLRRWKIFLAAKGEFGPECFARTWSEWDTPPPMALVRNGAKPTAADAMTASMQRIFPPAKP